MLVTFYFNVCLLYVLVSLKSIYNTKKGRLVTTKRHVKKYLSYKNLSRFTSNCLVCCEYI